MEDFKFAIHGTHLSLVTPSRGISDQYKVYSARFDFRSPDWEGADKWAHFVPMGGSPILVNLYDDVITAERELELEAGVYEVFVHGDFEEGGAIVKRLVTNSVDIFINQSGIEDGEVFPDFDSDVVDAIDAALDDAEDDAINGVSATVTDTVGTPACSPGIAATPVPMSVKLIFNYLQGNTITGVTPVTEGDNRGKITFSLKNGTSVVFNNLTTLINNWTYYTFTDSGGDGNIAMAIASV